MGCARERTGMARRLRHPNHDGPLWKRLDPESVRNTGGGVHHLASIVQDLRAIVEDCLHLLPDRLLLLPLLARRDGGLAVLTAVGVGLLWDLEEALLFAPGLLKNGLAILAHATRATWNLLNRRIDGLAVPVCRFDIADSDSALRLLLQQDRALRDLAIEPEPVPCLERATHRWRAGGLALVVTARRTLWSFNREACWRPRLAFRPGPAIEDLVTVLRWVRVNLPLSTRIKAGGARHSAGAGSTPGIYLHPEGMRFIERLPAGRSGRSPHPSLVRVGAGTTIRQVSERLWEWGRALPVICGFDGQTLAGAFNTGTHGSVLGQGPMAGVVRSIDLVRVDGTPVRIEPATGLDSGEEPGGPLCVIRDDDVFRAARLGLGALGVVHSYVVETVPRFHLEERTTETSLAEIHRVLEGGNVYALLDNRGTPSWVPPSQGRCFPGQPTRAYAMSILLNPHSTRAQVCTTRPVEVPEEPCDLALRVERNPAKAWARDTRFVRRPVGPRALLGLAPGLVARLPRLLTTLRLSDVPSVVDWSVQGSGVVVHRSYQIFHCGDGAARLPMRYGEFFVPLRDDRYLVAFDTLIGAARRWHAQTGLYQTGPISIRFIAGGDALLGPQEDFAAFECVFLGSPPHMPAMMRAYKEALTAGLGISGFSMHFGMETPGWCAEEVAAQLPEYWRWREIRDDFDPHGQLLNEAQEQLLPARPDHPGATIGHRSGGAPAGTVPSQGFAVGSPSDGKLASRGERI